MDIEMNYHWSHLLPLTTKTINKEFFAKNIIISSTTTSTTTTTTLNATFVNNLFDNNNNNYNGNGTSDNVSVRFDKGLIVLALLVMGSLLNAIVLCSALITIQQVRGKSMLATQVNHNYYRGGGAASRQTPVIDMIVTILSTLAIVRLLTQPALQIACLYYGICSASLSTACYANGFVSTFLHYLYLWTMALIVQDRYIAHYKQHDYLSKCSHFVLYVTLICVAFLTVMHICGPIYGFSEYRFLEDEFSCSIDWRVRYSCAYFVYSTLFVSGPAYVPLLYWTIRLSGKMCAEKWRQIYLSCLRCFDFVRFRSNRSGNEYSPKTTKTATKTVTEIATTTRNNTAIDSEAITNYLSSSSRATSSATQCFIASSQQQQQNNNNNNNNSYNPQSNRTHNAISNWWHWCPARGSSTNNAKPKSSQPLSSNAASSRKQFLNLNSLLPACCCCCFCRRHNTTNDCGECLQSKSLTKTTANSGSATAIAEEEEEEIEKNLKTNSVNSEIGDCFEMQTGNHNTSLITQICSTMTTKLDAQTINNNNNMQKIDEIVTTTTTTSTAKTTSTTITPSTAAQKEIKSNKTSFTSRLLRFDKINQIEKNNSCSKIDDFRRFASMRHSSSNNQRKPQSVVTIQRECVSENYQPQPQQQQQQQQKHDYNINNNNFINRRSTLSKISTKSATSATAANRIMIMNDESGRGITTTTATTTTATSVNNNWSSSAPSAVYSATRTGISTIEYHTKSNLLTRSNELRCVTLCACLFVLAYTPKACHNAWIACGENDPYSPQSSTNIIDADDRQDIESNQQLLSSGVDNILSSKAENEKSLLGFALSVLDESASALLIPFTLLLFHEKLRYSLIAFVAAIFVVCRRPFRAFQLRHLSMMKFGGNRRARRNRNFHQHHHHQQKRHCHWIIKRFRQREQRQQPQQQQFDLKQHDPPQPFYRRNTNTTITTTSTTTTNTINNNDNNDNNNNFSGASDRTLLKKLRK